VRNQLAVLCLLLAALPARAHHSFAAEFDQRHPLHVEGTVSRLDWSNPHTLLYLDIASPSGKATWVFEGGTPGQLRRRGVTKDDLKPGTVLKMDGYPAKDGSRRAYGSRITLGDGRRFFFSGSENQSDKP
jgi:Family of unknown function (DUF6152)